MSRIGGIQRCPALCFHTVIWIFDFGQRINKTSIFFRKECNQRLMQISLILFGRSKIQFSQYCQDCKSSYSNFAQKITFSSVASMGLIIVCWPDFCALLNLSGFLCESLCDQLYLNRELNDSFFLFTIRFVETLYYIYSLYTSLHDKDWIENICRYVTYDDFKKKFSGLDFCFKLLMQFSRTCRDESIGISEYRKFENFL